MKATLLDNIWNSLDKLLGKLTDNQQRKFFWALWALSLLFAVVWLLASFGYRVNLTPSMPKGIYQHTAGPLKHGDLVSFCLADPEFIKLAQERGYLQGGSCPSGLQPLFKRVAALPGDSLSVTAEGISINGQLWANSQIQATDSAGRAMFCALLPAEVPAGQALLLSDEHRGSFDSRYFGLAGLNRVNLVKPLWIWN